MMENERILVLESLRELEGWSDYILEALTLDRKEERTNIRMLEQSIGERELREIRELSWSLFDKFHLINTKLELTRGEPLLAGTSVKERPSSLGSDLRSGWGG